MPIYIENSVAVDVDMGILRKLWIQSLLSFCRALLLYIINRNLSCKMYTIIITNMITCSPL